MRKLLFAITAIALIGTADASAQGFLKKMKQKAQQAVMGGFGINTGETPENTSETPAMGSEPQGGMPPQGISVPEGSDIVPKRKTPTVTWDGVVTPSTASSAAALMAELPQMPTAEQMARSTMEEREAYTLKIAAVVARVEQLQAADGNCSDAEMEALRLKWEKKLEDLFGLTKEEMAILNDENASESKKEPIRQKMMTKVLGANVDMAEMERFQNMSEKEQEAYIKAHPEFVQKMQEIAMNAGNFAAQARQMTEAVNSYEAQIGQLTQHMVDVTMEEDSHSYEGIARKYEDRLQQLYSQICGSSDAAQTDKLYAQADELLYNYRIEAAREYRVSLLRLMDEHKKFAAEYSRLSQAMVDSGELPACAVGRSDLNAVVAVANILDEAYKELPDVSAMPVCIETLYTLPEGWNFGIWECRGFMGSVEGFKAGSSWPLLADNRTGEQAEYAVVENGKFRKIDENELKRINQQADQRLKTASGSGQKPPYGTYKSHSGQRMVEYSKTGELIINGMTTFYPIAFTANGNTLEWIILEGREILKCIYKL